MSEVAAALGLGAVLRHKGREWPLSPLRIEHLALFSAWMEDCAWRKVERYQGTLPEAIYQGRLDAVARQVTSNAYDFGKPLFDEAWRSQAGRRYMVYLQLMQSGPEMTPQLANEIIDADPKGVFARVDALNRGPEKNGETAPKPEEELT